jgi:hypothetical protein
MGWKGKNLMFKVIAYKQINAGAGSCSSGDIYLIKKFELPFAPYKDLELKTGDWWLTIHDVHWDIDEGVFKIYAESDRQIYNAYNHKQEPLSIHNIVDEYIENYHWEIEPGYSQKKYDESKAKEL